LWSSSAVTGQNCLCCGNTLTLVKKQKTYALTDSNLLREQYLSTEMIQCKPKSGGARSMGTNSVATATANTSGDKGGGWNDGQ